MFFSNAEAKSNEGKILKQNKKQKWPYIQSMIYIYYISNIWEAYPESRALVSVYKRDCLAVPVWKRLTERERVWVQLGCSMPGSGLQRARLAASGMQHVLCIYINSVNHGKKHLTAFDKITLQTYKVLSCRRLCEFSNRSIHIKMFK